MKKMTYDDYLGYKNEKQKAKALKEFKFKHYLCTTKEFGKEYLYNDRVYDEKGIEALFEKGAL